MPAATIRSDFSSNTPPVLPPTVSFPVSLILRHKLNGDHPQPLRLIRNKKRGHYADS
jgi:hypothetical protein